MIRGVIRYWPNEKKITLLNVISLVFISQITNIKRTDRFQIKIMNIC